MLKELYIANYKSIKDTTIEFKDGLNIIIGKNGAGKSNLLAFIYQYLSLEYIFPDIFLTHRTKRSSPMLDFSFYIKDYDNFGEYKIQASIEKSPKKTENNIAVKTEASKTYLSTSNKEHNYFYNSEIDEKKRTSDFIDDFYLSKTHIQYNIPANIPWLDKSQTLRIDSQLNANWEEAGSEDFDFLEHFEIGFTFDIDGRIIDSQKRNDIIENIKNFLFDKFNSFIGSIDLNRTLSEYSPINEIRISQNANFYRIEDNILIDNLSIEFRIGENWVPWSYLSDGTKRLFYIISELCNRKAGMILIEEPELGIHPHQLFNLMSLIKEQSQNKQIILSTHSPIVLDILNDNELDRIIIASIKDNASSFNHLSEEKIAKAKAYMHDAELSYYWQHSDLEND